MADALPVDGRVPRTMVRWRAQARARAATASRHAKRNPKDIDSRNVRTLLLIARLPPTLREAVDAAIADGATIDEITALIRGEGGACSRSAVGRYTKNVRDLIRQGSRRPTAGRRGVGAALGEARAEGRAGLILIETLRTADALRPGRSQRGGERRRRRRKSSPACRWFSGASRAPTSSASSGSRRRRRRRPRPRPARARPQARHRSGRASRPRPSPLSARSSRAGPARPSAPSHRRRSTRGILRNPTYPT